MAAIKNFFKKKKMDVKFSMAGPGHRLCESRPPTVEAIQERIAPTPRQPPSESAQRAAEAAAARLQGPLRSGSKSSNVGGRSLLAQARAEVREAEERDQSYIVESETLRKRFAEPEEVVLEAGGTLAVRGVYFSCPFVSPEVLCHSEWETRIRDFLLEQARDEPGLTAAVMIHTLNKPVELVTACVDVLCRLLQNVEEHPDEDKFRRVRLNNRMVAEKVLPLEGSLLLLEAAGFRREIETTDKEGGEGEEVLKMSRDDVNFERLSLLRQALQEAEPIRPQLDRGAQLLLVEDSAISRLGQVQLPNDFFSLSIQEIRKEQQLRTEALASAGMLKTKAMREREARQELRRYRFCLLRIRLPPHGRRVVQAIFAAHESFTALYQWLRQEVLRNGDALPFGLCAAGGVKFSETDSSMAELGLCPSAVLNLTLESDIVRQLEADFVQDWLLQTAQQLLLP